MKLLYLISKSRFTQKMSRTRFMTMEQISKQPEITRYMVTGNGWEGYSERASLEENLKGLDFKPDILVAYKPEDHTGIKQSNIPLKVIRFNEAWWSDSRAHNEAMAMGAHLVICHHENDLKRFQGPYRTVHIPHCVHPGIFYQHDPFKSRTRDCIVTGSLHRDVYPLRCRWADLVSSGRLVGIVRTHPGSELHPEVAQRQLQDYANDLRRSRVALVCSSKYRYALAKYVEAFMAGCVVVGDMPDDGRFKKTLGKYLVEMSPDASDQELTETVEAILGDLDLMQTISREATQLALAEYSSECYAREFIQVTRECLTKNVRVSC